MNSAQYFESNLPSTSKNLFFQTWPGWTWGRYEHRKLYSEHRYLADMLPVTSTFTGHLKTAEAIYDGPANNLVGVETFSGGGGSASPQHAVLLGMSGAGKSVTVCDLLSQTEGYFAYTVIIEEGLSYGIYTQTVEEGACPIIIHPDGDLTINYLDTKGLPLTPDHLSASTALVARMIGTSAEEDKQMLRQAQIAKYLNLLYEDAFQDWQKKRHDQLLDIARHALALQKFRVERMPPGATTLETFADFRDWKASHLNEANEYLAAFNEAEVLRFLKEPKTSREVRNLAFAYFSPEEFPTHRMLQELMMLDPMGSERDQITEIATLDSAVVSGRQLRLFVRWHEQFVAHRKNRPFRIGLHPTGRASLEISEVFSGKYTDRKNGALENLGEETGAGVSTIVPPHLSSDGTAYAYLYVRVLSEAYVVTGLK